MGKDSPGPGVYESDSTALIKSTLSVTKTSQQYSIPRNERFSYLGKSAVPAPNSYVDSNSISNKFALKRNGAYSMPKQERKFDFAKFSSMHNVLISKGYY